MKGEVLRRVRSVSKLGCSEGVRQKACSSEESMRFKKVLSDKICYVNFMIGCFPAPALGDSFPGFLSFPSCLGQFHITLDSEGIPRHDQNA
jgi:hypothetical protein